MALTVQDCLKLPTLEKAVVLGGRQGLDRLVDFVTVMEATHKEDIVPDFFKKNQMALSSFTAIKNDVSAQCALLRILNECHTSGLILFQYGLYLSKVDERVVQTADELGFPLIYLEMDNYEIIYTDVIHDITGLIFRTQLNSHFFIPELFHNLNLLIDGDADTDSLLQLLAERLNGMLLLLDQEQNALAASEIPVQFRALCGGDEHSPCDNAADLVKSVLEQVDPQQSAGQYKSKYSLTLQDSQLMLYVSPLVDKYGNNLYLWHLTEDLGNLDILHRQITSIVMAYLNRLSHNIYGNHSELLIRAILSRQYELQQQLSAKLKIDLNKIGALWLVLPGRNGNPYVSPINDKDYEKAFTPLLRGSYQNSQVIFLPKQDAEYDYIKEISAIIEKMGQRAGTARHFVQNVLNSIDDMVDFYELVNKNDQAAAIVYPHKKVFAQPELFFVHNLQRLHQSMGEEADEWLDALKPLRQDEDLLILLETMLLDTNINVNECTRILYIHKNTVYYRLKKIRALFGFDPFSQPANHNLAIALAHRRLILND